ncbi:hypothetical protein D9M70_557360 [compost metagenome]
MALTATVRASASDAPCPFIQKNALRVNTSSARPMKMIRQIPKPVRIGRSTARGRRVITSASWGSKQITRPSATEVTIFTQSTCGAVIGRVKPRKIATAITSPWAKFVGKRNRIAFSMLL